MPTVYVVIPYYQKGPEPLVRAIQSVLDQCGVSTPEVVIVDDGSPYPAARVIEEHFQGCTNLHVIKQRNSGASAARNAGLGGLPDAAEFVAFLDSDDEWVPDHLARALLALGKGSDFYFADHKRSDWAESKFSMINFQVAAHECVDAGKNIYRYVGDPILPILRDHLIQTSTVVLRWATCSRVRFRTDLVLGEDELYWIDAIRCTNSVSFCNCIAVNMGRGINISQNAEQDCRKEAELVAQNLSFWKNLPNWLPEETAIDALRTFKIRQLRANFASAFLQCIKVGRSIPMRQVFRFTLNNPAWLVSLNSQVLRSIAGKCGFCR